MQVFTTSHQEIDETARIVALKCYDFVAPGETMVGKPLIQKPR